MNTKSIHIPVSLHQIKGYKASAADQAQLAEESAQYVAKVLDPDEEWEEYQE